jgi:uncharacterized protein
MISASVPVDTGEKAMAVITGASFGIGMADADRVTKRGYDLILIARREGKRSAIAQRLRSECDIS